MASKAAPFSVFGNSLRESLREFFFKLDFGTIHADAELYVFLPSLVKIDNRSATKTMRRPMPDKDLGFTF